MTRREVRRRRARRARHWAATLLRRITRSAERLAYAQLGLLSDPGPAFADPEVEAMAQRMAVVIREAIVTAPVEKIPYTNAGVDQILAKAQGARSPMTNRNQQYSDAVTAGDFPEGAAVPFDPAFIDDRGSIQNLLLAPISSVARIASRRGAVRANHLHRTDWHYAFVESGRVYYFERAAGDASIPEPRLFEAGEMFFTRPGVEHAMLFAEDSVIYTFARNVRDHAGHEADLERVAFVTPDVAARYVRP